MSIDFRKYTRTQVLADDFLKDTGNTYEVVSQRPYTSKKPDLADGVTLTLKILQDKVDPGVDPETGMPRDNSEDENFEATICCGQKHLPLVKHDIVKLIKPIYEHCWYINYTPILRFKSIEKCKS